MEYPDLRFRWIKGEGRKLDFTKQVVDFILGKIDSGKSSLLEVLGSKYLLSGAKVIDLFGAHDGEGLAWLRSKHVKEDGKRIVLFHDRGTTVDAPCETMDVSKFKLADLSKADIFISASPLYAELDNEFKAVNHIIDELWKRHWWTEPIFMIVREAGNLLYSRLKISPNEKEAKAWYIYMMRESRHAGLSLGLDSLRPLSIDIDIRSLTNYLFLKNLGTRSLPDDMEWIYKTIAPEAMRRLKQNEFVIVDDGGAIGIGVSDCPDFHKLERENILQEVGVTVKYNTPGRG